MLGRVAIAVAILAVATPARAQNNRRIVVAGADGALVPALRAALEPWALELVTVDEDPGTAMPAAAQRARAIALAHDARAVVWVSGDAAGHALWVYDVADDRVDARPLASAPPYDEPTAAAIALSTKTLLLHSAVAPDELRLVPRGARAPTPRRVRFTSTASAHVRRTEAASVETRLGFGVWWWPEALDDRAGFAVHAAAGPGTALDDPAFVGRFTAVTAGALAGYDVALGGGVRLVPQLGASVHWTALDGAVLDRGLTVHVSRANPSLDAAVELRRELVAGVGLGVRVSMSYMLRSQRYLVDGEPILDLPSVELDAAIVLDLPIF